MKSIKPNNMALSFKVQVLEHKEILSISAFATFSFNISEARLFDEQELWKLADLNLGKDEILDFGVPKHRGEFLIYGSCYSEKQNFKNFNYYGTTLLECFWDKRSRIF